MNIVVTGSRGLLGSQIVKCLKLNGDTVVEANLPVYDILKPEAIQLLLSRTKIDYLINCAAYTDVAKSERDHVSAAGLNVVGVSRIAQLCLKYGVGLIHFSTDFVFDGMAQTPYTEVQPPNPINFYGMSKLRGEQSVHRIMSKSKNYTLFRLQWLYGDNPKTFFIRLLSQAKMGDVNIVEGEFGSPCSVQFVSETLRNYLNMVPRLTGETYHLTHDNFCDRVACGKFFLTQKGLTTEVTSYIATPMGVQRPKFGVMDNAKLKTFLGVSTLGLWEDDLQNFVNNFKC